MRKFESTKQNIKENPNLADLNRAVLEFHDILRELKTLNTKAEEALDDTKMRFSASGRLKATKIVRELDVNINTVTATISRFKND